MVLWGSVGKRELGVVGTVNLFPLLPLLPLNLRSTKVSLPILTAYLRLRKVLSPCAQLHAVLVSDGPLSLMGTLLS